MRRFWPEGPRAIRWAVTCGCATGIIGAAVGLVIGLFVHWQTAWFATFELGVPAALVGGVAGLALGLAITAVVSTTGR